MSDSLSSLNISKYANSTDNLLKSSLTSTFLGNNGISNSSNIETFNFNTNSSSNNLLSDSTSNKNIDSNSNNLFLVGFEEVDDFSGEQYGEYVFQQYFLQYGDVNGDGQITSVDAILVQNYITSNRNENNIVPSVDSPDDTFDFNNKIIDSRIEHGMGDIDGDGKVTINDATLIQKYLTDGVIEPTNITMANRLDTIKYTNLQTQVSDDLENKKQNLNYLNHDFLSLCNQYMTYINGIEIDTNISNNVNGLPSMGSLEDYNLFKNGFLDTKKLDLSNKEYNRDAYKRELVKHFVGALLYMKNNNNTSNKEETRINLENESCDWFIEYAEEFVDYIMEYGSFENAMAAHQKDISLCQSNISSLIYSKKQVNKKVALIPYDNIMKTADFKKYANNTKIETLDPEKNDKLKNCSKYMDFYKYLDISQLTMFNYLLETQGEDEANKYLEAYEEDINQAKGLESAGQFIDKLDKNFVKIVKDDGNLMDDSDIAVAQELVNNNVYDKKYDMNDDGKLDSDDITKLSQYVDAGGEILTTFHNLNITYYDGFLDGFSKFFAGFKYIADDTAVMSVDEYKMMFIAQKLQQTEALSFTYEFGQTVGNMTPTIIAAAVATLATAYFGGEGGVAVLGTTLSAEQIGEITAGSLIFMSTYGNSKHDALVKGHSLETAVGYGVLSGLSEAGLETLLGSLPFVGKECSNVFTAMFKEGLSESIQEFVGTMLGQCMLGEEVDITNLSADMGKAFIFGALLSGGSNAINTGVKVTINELKFELSNSQIMDYYNKSIDPVTGENNGLTLQEYVEKNCVTSSVSKDAKDMINRIDAGYIPSDEYILKNYEIFSNDEVLDKLLNSGYIPSPKVLESSLFFGNALAQQKVIEKNPESLLKLDPTSEIFTQFWIEAFKMNYIPDNIIYNYYIMSNPLLLKKIIRQKPEMIKYCQIIDKNESVKIDEFAIRMGYEPTITEIIDSEYLRKSSIFMEILIQKIPEASSEDIKYIETKLLKGDYSLDIPQNEFLDLVRLVINKGYKPTLEDIEANSRLADSFDVMKILIQDNPELINRIRNQTPDKEELLQIAIKNGFNGDLIDQYYDGKEENQLLYTETAIKYEFEKNNKLRDDITYGHNYSKELYNYFMVKGYNLENIIDMFTENEEVMKLIISENPGYVNKISKNLSREAIDELCKLAIDCGYEPKPEDEIFGYGNEVAKIMINKYPEYVNKISKNFSREAIDELCKLAIDCGYEPQFEDEIFGYGNEAAKIMVSIYPDYLDKVKLFDGSNINPDKNKPIELYEEICKTALDNGYKPKKEDIATIAFNPSFKSYQYSYSIMEYAIKNIDPSLIEYCNISDKEQYDTLCKLAIENGYTIPNNYKLIKKWGANLLRTNYDMMVQYISKNPDSIVDVEITNSDEMINLIDIAIKNGLQINSLDQKQLMKIFLPVDETKWKNYLDPSTIELLQKAKRLYVNNSEIYNTVNLKFLSENVTSNFTIAQVEILSCYPKLQEKILSLYPHEAKIIFELSDKYKDNLEWISILEKVLNNIDSPEFSNLLSSIKEKELTMEEKENLFYLLMTDNHLDISSYEDLKNIDSIRDKYIDKLESRNTLESLKMAYFEKIYGIDLSTAIYLVNTYGKSLESDAINNLTEDRREEFFLLEHMKKIINLNNIDDLRYYVENINPEIVVKPDLMVTYEARLKYLFTKEFNDSFTKPVEEDRVVSNVEGEKDLDIYLAAGHDGKKKCRMMITSIGAYTNIAEPDDYYASWNVDKIASHGCCCSYVGEKNLGTAEVKYCCLGFTDYELGTLQLSGPYDLSSFSTEDSFQISSVYSSMYLLPDDFLDYTRHTHNEIVWERRNTSGDKIFKKQPSYIVYFVDNFEDRLTDPEAMKQWESVKKAANDFATTVDGVKKPLPIMVVEREKIAKSQNDIIYSKLDEFKETLNPELILEIVSDYESNYAGSRNYHLNISEKYFPKHEKLSNSVVGEIIKKIKEIYKTKPDIAKQCLEELEKAVRSEQKKYNIVEYVDGQSSPSFNIEEALTEINDLKSILI